MTRRRSAAARRALVGRVVVALALGCAGAAGVAQAATGPAPPPGCTPLPPTPASRLSGAGPVLSGSVAAIRLCRYGALPARRRLGQYLTQRQAVITSLAKQLNGLRRVPKGPTSCPADNGSEILVVVRYSSGLTASVTVELTGCRIVSRGNVGRSAAIGPGGAALVARLERLTAGHR